MFWKLIAWIVTRQFITNWLLRKAQARPYWHIADATNPDDIYMYRWWLVKRDDTGWWRWFVPEGFCVRVHRIMRPDGDRHLHSHPFNFRTIILGGSYIEEVPDPSIGVEIQAAFRIPFWAYMRKRGYTGKCPYGGFHRIASVETGGALTLFIMWGGKRDDWGFMTETGYVPNQEYFAQRGIKESANG